ncbi:MFS transporter [Streptomyces sp. NPDC008121]|uniref:MFS transporter n=1 Tax=Streptomyces sp. NPDC008121 TaxID=3364809 RepID=UPI0036E34B69
MEDTRAIRRWRYSGERVGRPGAVVLTGEGDSSLVGSRTVGRRPALPGQRLALHRALLSAKGREASPGQPPGQKADFTMAVGYQLAYARRATFTAFALMGAVSAVWVVRIPALRETMKLSEAQIGIEVLAWGMGALVAMQASRRLFARLGTRCILRVALPGAVTGLLLLAFAPSYPFLLAGGFIFGILFGLVDVAANAQAAQLEQASGRPLMGMMHAGWSLGAVAGGVAGAATASLGMGFTASVASVSLLALPGALAVTSHFLPDQDSSDYTDFMPDRLPRTVLLLGALMFCAFLAEGAVADWSSLHLHDGFGASEAVAALAYPVFELAMLTVRLGCDRITRRFGGRALLAVAGLAAALGFAVVIFSRSVIFVFGGLSLVGGAISVVVPLTFSLAGLAGGQQSSAAVARAGTLGYTGLLLGPVAIGFLAEHSSVRAGFGVVLAACALIAAGAWALPDLRVGGTSGVPLPP